MRITRNVKDQLISFVKQYARRVYDSSDPIATINAFDATKAKESVIKRLTITTTLTPKDKELINDAEFQSYVETFFKEKLPINYLMMKRSDIGYYEAKAILTDKGCDYFPELKGMKNSVYTGRFDDYKATPAQISYITDLGMELRHEDELTGREASLIISCLKNPKKTKPAYFTYYENTRIY